LNEETSYVIVKTGRSFWVSKVDGIEEEKLVSKVRIDMATCEVGKTSVRKG